jgi:hypothetical protein
MADKSQNQTEINIIRLKTAGSDERQESIWFVIIIIIV